MLAPCIFAFDIETYAPVFVVFVCAPHFLHYFDFIATVLQSRVGCVSLPLAERLSIQRVALVCGVAIGSDFSLVGIVIEAVYGLCVCMCLCDEWKT